MKLINFTIVIVNYNSGYRLRKSILSLIEQSYQEWKCIIVDNYSTDESLNVLDVLDDRFLIVKNYQNLGFAAANNLAFDLVESPWVITLNPDAYPENDWLYQIDLAIKKYPNNKIFGCKQINEKNHNILDGAGDCYHILGFPWRGGYGQNLDNIIPEGEVFSPCAAAAIYSNYLLRELRGFDEDFFCYCEDVDLGFRARLIGERTIQLADAVVYHEGSAITGSTSYFTLYHSSRNRLWTYIKNMPSPIFYIFFPFHIIASLYLIFRNPDKNSIKPQLLGFLDGCKRFPEIIKKRRLIQKNRKISIISLIQLIRFKLSSLRERKIYIKNNK